MISYYLDIPKYNVKRCSIIPTAKQLAMSISNYNKILKHFVSCSDEYSEAFSVFYNISVYFKYRMLLGDVLDARFSKNHK